MNTTKDTSDYLWYTLRWVTSYDPVFNYIMLYSDDFGLISELIDFMNRFENNLSCSAPILVVHSAAHVAHAFVNNEFIGT